MNEPNRKDLKAAYLSRKVTGGVCAVRNAKNGKLLLLCAPDLHGMKNRFEFSQSIGGCMHKKLEEDWKSFGPGAFSFEVLEELVKKEDQTPKEFKEDLDTLTELWAEKFPPESLY
jgi:hypothetical protein